MNNFKEMLTLYFKENFKHSLLQVSVVSSFLFINNEEFAFLNEPPCGGGDNHVLTYTLVISGY